MKYQYAPQGTCSRLIDIEIDDNGLISDVKFTGGCNGNLKGLSALARGKRPSDVIACLEGITCGAKPTSCPDQFAKALREITGARS